MTDYSYQSALYRRAKPAVFKPPSPDTPKRAAIATKAATRRRAAEKRIRERDVKAAGN